MEEVESFDFFDTILTRNFVRPEDLFYFLGLSLYADGIIALKPNDFQKARMEAEKVARKISKFEEVTINEIYDVLKAMTGLDDKIIQEIKKKELEFELLESTPIAENVRKINANSILVSDTYLPKSFLETLLNKSQINTYREIFASSETKFTKASGKMYELIAKKFKIRKHVGDNPHSDFRVPKGLGIMCELYTSSKPTRYERSIYHEKSIPFEVRALIAGAMRATRLAIYYENNIERRWHEISSNVMAPFLNLYCLWVLERAQKFGLEKLFFLSRDGKILYEISTILKKVFPNFDIELRYLPCSRRSLFIPAISEDYLEPLKWIFENKRINKEYFCKIFEISSGKINSEFLSFNDVLENQKLLNICLETAEKKRRILVKFLKQEGFSKNSKSGVVDVGWRGRLQAAISKVLKIEGIYNDIDGIKGFYIGLVNPVENLYSDEKIVFLNFEKYRHLYHAELIERFTAADHGSCIGYKEMNGTVVPIFEDNLNNMEIIFTKIQHKSIKTFSNKFSNALFLYKISPELVNDYGRKIIDVLMSKFIYSPHKEEVTAFENLEHASDISHTNYVKLAERLSYKEILVFNLPRIRKLFWKDKKCPYWIEGSNAITLPNPIAYVLNYLRLFYRKFIS
jgi:predicted HAD superfamily hydrolase